MNVLRHVNAINMGVCILILVIGCANAKVLKRCILPAPDGGVEKLSKPNLHGVIKKVDLNTNEAEIKIKEGVLENDPYLEFNGEDQQLNKAIEVILEKLKTEKKEVPAIPEFPVK